MRSSAGTSGYHRLAVRLNKFPQGAPTSKALYEILALLFSPQEAELVSKLPLRVFTARRAARAWGMDVTAARRKLNLLCRKALLVDIEQNGRMTYCLPPPMAGFFEFSLMRRRTDIDQKALAERLYRYINMEEDFAAALFARGHTQLGRVFVNEPQIPTGYRLEVLDHELASQTIAAARTIGVSQCYCRHKMALAQKACDAPQDICLTLNMTAASLVRHGHATSLIPGKHWKFSLPPAATAWSNSAKMCAGKSTSSAIAVNAAAKEWWRPGASPCSIRSTPPIFWPPCTRKPAKAAVSAPGFAPPRP